MNKKIFKTYHLLLIHPFICWFYYFLQLLLIKLLLGSKSNVWEILILIFPIFIPFITTKFIFNKNLSKSITILSTLNSLFFFTSLSALKIFPTQIFEGIIGPDRQFNSPTHNFFMNIFIISNIFLTLFFIVGIYYFLKNKNSKHN